MFSIQIPKGMKSVQIFLHCYSVGKLMKDEKLVDIIMLTSEKSHSPKLQVSVGWLVKISYTLLVELIPVVINERF